MTAILFGSIGTLADTSELQREAFNEAFAQHGLDWNWSQEEYRQMLRDSGGQRRIGDYAARREQQVDVGAIHATKSKLFQEKLRSGAITPRPGVAETIDAAQRDGTPVALVTTTSPENVAAVTEALAPDVDVSAFALVIDTSDVENDKPAPDAYQLALRQLGIEADEAVAVEDNVGGAAAAARAGIACIAFPGVNNADHDFASADDRVDELSYDALQAVAARA